MSSVELLTSTFTSALSFAMGILIMNIYFSWFFPRRENKFVPLVYVIYILIWSIHFPGLPIVVNNVTRSIISNVLIVSVCFRGNIIRKISFVGIFFLMSGLAEFLIAILLTVLGIGFQFDSRLGALLSQALLLLVILYLNNFWGTYSIKNQPPGQYLLLLLLPLGSLYIIYKIYMYGAESDSSLAILETSVCLAIIILMNFVIFRLYISLTKEIAAAKYNVAYAQQLELYSKSVQERTMSMAEYRRIRHDIKQHYASILSLLEKHQYETVEEYIRKLVEDNTENMQVCRTENTVIDAIINAKYSLMKMQGIEYFADIHIPMQLPFESADMSVLLGNVLDNAIEANNDNAAHKYIKIYMAYDKNILIITVVNSYDGTLLRDKTGKILTRKRDKSVHGFGLVSVEKIVQKYHGSMVIEDSAEEFKIKLILIDDSI